jgi:predicted deacetylase
MIRKLFAIIVLFTCRLTFSQDSIYFVIRVDDIQSRNTTTVPRSIIPFQQAVEQRGGKVTWAVIPHRLIETQNQNGVLSKEIRESVLNGHEVALHGYIHICQSCNQSGHEMFCTTNNIHFSYAQQQQLISNGLQILHDTLNAVPKTFVPPGHQADIITYQVLIDNGFNWLSSVGGTKKYIYKTLYNLQQNNEYTWQLTASQYNTKLTTALQDIKNTGSANGYYCLLFHDPFIRKGYENGLVVRWIGELLDSLNNHYGNKIKYLTLGQAANIFRQQTPTHIINSELVPVEFALYQNYPNPFNPATRIQYQVSSSSHVSLKVYDVLGKEVATLVNQEMQPGYYAVDFRAKSIASGVYVYRLVAGKFVSTKKMMVNK